MIGIISKMGQPSNKASNVSRSTYPPQERSAGREFGHTKNFIMALMLLLAGTVVYGDGPYGDVAFRRMGTHNGNLIATIFFNQGDISGWHGWGYPPPRIEWPKGSGHEYGDENSLLVIAEVVNESGETIHILSESSLDWDATDTNPILGGQMGWEPLPGFFNPAQGSPAMSDLLESWPSQWPDRINQDDPGWPGSWNGYFGRDVFQADQESYYVMDDNYNVEFDYFPDNTDPDRHGLGLQVSVRGLQWSDPLAQDCIFWLYDITNVSTTTYDKIVFGEVFDARVGGTGEENDDLAEFISYGNMDITYSWDSDNLGSGGWSPVGYIGFAFLESPGIDQDGIDNDDDGLIDESRDNDAGIWLDVFPYGIDDVDNFKLFYKREPVPHWSGDEDGDWLGFGDLNGNGEWEPSFEVLNDDLGMDGIGPNHPKYPGWDTGEGDGIPTQGEPNFGKTDVDESDQIGLTGMESHVENSVVFANDELMWTLLQPNRWVLPDPGLLTNYEFFYSSGFFLLEPGKTERFSLALLLGEDKDDILRNKKTVQNIYDANYRFKSPPLKPKLLAAVGDNKVTLYWDRLAERSRDPVYGFDFEGYMIYKSTWYDFSDSDPVTDSYGNVVFFEPVAQFDLVDGLVGPHSVGIGSEPGIDEPTGANLNMGTDNGLEHFWVDTDVLNGQTYYYAIVSYDKGYDTDFFARGLTNDSTLLVASPSICAIDFELDKLGNVVGPGVNTAIATPSAPVSGYVPPDLSELEHISGPATGTIIYDLLDPLKIKDNTTYHFLFDDTSANEIIYTVRDITDSRIVLFNQTGVYGDNSLEFDGLMLTIYNDSTANYNPSNSGWIGGSSNYELQVTYLISGGEVYRSPSDYIIFFDSTYIDTSWHPTSSSLNNRPAKFQVWDMTYPENPKKLKFAFKERSNSQNGLFDSRNDYIYIWTELEDGVFERSWKMWMEEPPFEIYDTTGVGQDMTIDTIYVDPIIPTTGDTLFISITKPFRSGDIYELNTMAAFVNRSVAKNSLDRIVVVPNPYVAAASWEQKLPPGIISGRGERKIGFINLPETCTIRIYTTRGYLVRLIEHESTIADGTEFWDLKTKDGMEVAFGLYFFHIDADELGEKLGRFAIIK